MSTASSAARAKATSLYAFIVMQFACQLALLAPIGSARIGFRILTFASSLAMLVLIPAGGAPHPLRAVTGAFLVVLSLGMFHPELNSTLSGLGSIALNAAIWCPIFWAGWLKVGPDSFSRVILLMWVFHSTSAVAGVLQVYDPERFAPDPTFIEAMLGEYAEGLKLTLDDGRKIYRPFGLTDAPGGAAGSGAFAATVGLILSASKRPIWLRAAGVLSAVIGMFCVYICQFRSALIVTCLGFVFIAVLAAWRGHTVKAGMLVCAILGAVLGGFVWVTAIGGEAVTGRLETLTEDDAATVYYSNRGHFLETTLTEDLPTYPLGAGLGRWGMMYNYFGDKMNLNSPAVWVEIQATAWVIDGGFPLLILGYAAAIGACVMAFRIAFLARSDVLADSAAVVAATNISVLLATMGYPVFISQGGMMFWVLNAALYTAAVANKISPADRRAK